LRGLSIGTGKSGDVVEESARKVKRPADYSSICELKEGTLKNETSRNVMKVTLK